MLDATALDGESYIMFADFGTVDFYTIFLHYKDVENFQSNYGALDIVHYYSNDCNYIGNGTKIDFEVVELNKKSLVLHYYGVGITSDGKSVDIDDTWKIDMTTLWNGEYAQPELQQFHLRKRIAAGGKPTCNIISFNSRKCLWDY